MRYADPELRERLAAEYVLGTMPIRARRRFEQQMATEADLALAVARWNARLAPLDAMTPPQNPPARVWRAISRRLPADPHSAPHRWPPPLTLWRGLAVAALGALAVVLLYFAAAPGPPASAVVAVLTDGGGAPVWVAARGPGRGKITVSALRPTPPEPDRSLELWGIAAGGRPRPLGLLAAAGGALIVAAADLPPPGGTLAVSLEPAGGSPTGQPTGRVLYQGKLAAAP